MTMTRTIHLVALSMSYLGLLLLAFWTGTCRGAGTTAFTYQGQLISGSSAANGSYDLSFALYDAATNGTILAGPITNAATSVNNGMFAVTLDFGSDVFNGASVWLQMGVRTNATGNFTMLFPPQRLLPTPYAIYATTAANVTNGAITAVQLAPNAIGTSNIQDGAVTDAKISATTTLARSVETNLVIVRGYVDKSGVIRAGQGFTATQISTGLIGVTFTIPFSGIPSVTLGQAGVSGTAVVDVYSGPSATGFTNISSSSNPSGFSFIAIGSQ